MQKAMSHRYSRNEFPHGVSDPLHIIILKYDYMNDYTDDYMKGVTNSVWNSFPSFFYRLALLITVKIWRESHCSRERP